MGRRLRKVFQNSCTLTFHHATLPMVKMFMLWLATENFYQNFYQTIALKEAPSSKSFNGVRTLLQLQLCVGKDRHTIPDSGFHSRFHSGFYTLPFSGPLSQKSDENPRMRVIPHSKFPPKCAHALILVAFFVTTDLKKGSTICWTGFWILDWTGLWILDWTLDWTLRFCS